MYDDRIEIISFGGLEYGTSIEEILKNPTSSRRNPLICDIFSRLDFMERRGSGIAKIMDAYKDDEKKPKLEIIGNMFIVTLYSRLYKNKSSENHPKIIRKSFENHPKNEILDYIKENGKSTKKSIMEDLGFAEGQVKYSIKTLKENGKIESIGNGKNTYYIPK